MLENLAILFCIIMTFLTLKMGNISKNMHSAVWLLLQGAAICKGVVIKVGLYFCPFQHGQTIDKGKIMNTYYFQSDVRQFHGTVLNHYDIWTLKMGNVSKKLRFFCIFNFRQYPLLANHVCCTKQGQ